ncbi:dolichol kinase [Halovenus marina]|uniref:dolichol kinase n=1 Tax=Halovenus marina TaxID=3396621 RepID=UPI003F552A08
MATAFREWAVAVELPRRLVHASGSALPGLYLLDVLTWSTVVLLFAVGAVGATALEFVRLSVGLDWVVFDRLTREYEQADVAGYALYMLSAAGVALAFAPQIAVPAILMLTLADPISGVISTGGFRRVKRPRSLAAMFCLCTAIAFPFASEMPHVAVLGGIAGMSADGVKPELRGFVVDDNLTIAPVAAGVMWLGMQVSGIA